MVIDLHFFQMVIQTPVEFYYQILLTLHLQNHTGEPLGVVVLYVIHESVKAVISIRFHLKKVCFWGKKCRYVQFHFCSESLIEILR